MQRIISSINLCLHNRFFDAEYIKRNNFKFDEEIIMAEDVHFTLLCYEKAEKIVVLPQFIGHNYFVNSKSAVQNNVRSREVTLKFSYGYKKIFDLLLNMGAYYNHFFLTLLNLYVKSAYRSPDFTAEDWATLRREMGPYAKMLTPPPVNKLFSKEQGQAVYEFVTSNLLEDKVNDHSAFINGEDNLRLILKSNADTAYGDFYNFNNINSADEYRRTVPIVDDNDYKKLMRLNMEVGETGLITKKKMKAYAYDFNASDEMRVFPMSEESCFEAWQNFANKLFGEVTFLMMETKPKGTPKNDGTYLDSPIGIMVNSAFEAFSLAYRGFDGKLTMPLTLLFAPEQGNMDYITLLMALRNENVTQIYSSNTWVVFNYLELLFKRGTELCDDIAAGNVKNNNNNSEYISRELAAWNQPDARRADEIRGALKSGNDPEEILLKIWPNLKRVIAQISGNYNFYTKKLKKYFKNIKLEFSDFVTPFGIIAKQDGDNFKLDYDKGFYEFLPVTHEKTINTLLVSEVKTGNLYELVLTNIDGLYRMRTGIIIKPVKVNADEFYFEECMRPYIDENNKIIINGEDFEQILEACLLNNLYDYLASYNKDAKRLDVYIELVDESGAAEDYAAKLESLLNNNLNYAKAREDGLNACKVIIIDKETNLLWRDMRRIKYNAPAGCFQPVHNIEDIKLIPLLKLYN